MSKELTREELFDSSSRPERQRMLCEEAWLAFEAYLDADQTLRRLLVKRAEAIERGTISWRLNNSLNRAQKEVKNARNDLAAALRKVNGRIDPELFLDDKEMLDAGYWLSARLADRRFLRYCRSARRHAYKDQWKVDKLRRLWQDYQEMLEREAEAKRKRAHLPPEEQLSFEFDE